MAEEGRDSLKRRRALTAQELKELFDRMPPHAPEAEMALLGSMLLDPMVTADVLMWVHDPRMFYVERNGTIFSALKKLNDSHFGGDLNQLITHLRDLGVLDEVGGVEYLVQLAEAVPSAAVAPHYARIVAEKSRIRDLIDEASQILFNCFNPDDPSPEGMRALIDRAESAIFKIAHQAERSHAQPLSELLQEELDRIERAEGQGLSGIATGFSRLDELLSGLQPGEMVIVAARPSMGKTALALNLAEQIAFGGMTPWDSARGKARVPVGIFSLEMSRSSVASRLISARSGVDSHKMRTGHCSNEEFAEIMRCCDELSGAPIYIDDTPSLSVLSLRAKARRMQHQHDVKALMIDYLQLVTAPGAARESRQVEVSEISRQIKALARELNVPIVCLAQLNRGAEQREGHRPRMSDLRESGSIEQDADVVILLHRESYYHVGDRDWEADNEDRKNLAELIIAKQRNGPTGTVQLTWDSSTTRFKNYSGGYAGEYDDPFADTAAPGRPASQVEPRSGGFAPSKKSGPVSDYRDGGGPGGAGDDLPPF